MSVPVTLSSPRVRLDLPTRADTVAIAAACVDPEIQRWTTVPSPYTPRHAHSFVDALVGPGWASGRERTWAIREPGSTWLRGVISLRSEHRDVGFWMAPEARGRGLMHAALDLVAAFALTELGWPDVYWECNVGNVASAAVARGCGFVYTGTGIGLLPGRDGEPNLVWHGLRAATGTPAGALPWPAETSHHA
ncbi:GNAT family N-acetyltransferase [Curtobacterium ammoniigenes]|uniref:GNAT family N-acetyltransferase n=1 Tax=Curtobacterium ammoniigenes TaxID=395387 RepID=UPI00082C189B|nr:GNAT family N-acetyltransferase [Curtobacterium ammoniigenes]